MARSVAERVGTVAAPTALSDGALAAFVQSLELAVESLYRRTATVLGSPAAVAAAGAFVAHHRAHAAAFGTLAGVDAVTLPDPSLLDALEPVAPLVSEHDGLSFLYALEGRLAATHQYLLGRFTTTPAISLGAGTLPVECQHVVVLGTLLSLPLPTLVPTTQGDDAHLVPEQYPLT